MFPFSIKLMSFIFYIIKDIEEYCQRLGIDLKGNPSLATLVQEWILQPLPRYWYPW